MNKHKKHLPANPHQGLPHEYVIWKGNTWPNNCWSWLCCSETKWLVTNRRMDITSGCCGSTEDTIDLRRVTDVKFHRSCIQFCCCRGTIEVYASEANKNELIKITTWGMEAVYKDLRDAWLQCNQVVATDVSGQ